MVLSEELRGIQEKELEGNSHVSLEITSEKSINFATSILKKCIRLIFLKRTSD